jgi:hypothetical protein
MILNIIIRKWLRHKFNLKNKVIILVFAISDRSHLEPMLVRFKKEKNPSADKIGDLRGCVTDSLCMRVYIVFSVLQLK